MTKLEKDIEAKLRRAVTRRGGWCLKWVCPGWSGVPDRIILLPGARVIFAELKRPRGGALSAMQKKWAEWLTKLGFSYWTIWDEDVLDVFIKAELEEHCDHHQPLTRRPGETLEQFIDRVVQRLTHNKLTPNAARASLGLPPIKKE